MKNQPDTIEAHLLSACAIAILAFLALGSIDSYDSSSPEANVSDAPTPYLGFEPWLAGKAITHADGDWVIGEGQINNLEVGKITNETGDELNYSAYLSFRVADGSGKGLLVKGICDYKIDKVNSGMSLKAFSQTKAEKVGIW